MSILKRLEGYLSDHYDPRSKTVRLSSDNYHGHSVAAAAIAAHEVGHAIQDKEAYSFSETSPYTCSSCKYRFEFFLDINYYRNATWDE